LKGERGREGEREGGRERGREGGWYIVVEFKTASRFSLFSRV
jgi:hypothetical protein